MKKIFLLLAVTAFLSLLLVSCATTGPVRPKDGRYVTWIDFAQGEIKLPANCSKENFRKLLLGVSVQDVKFVNGKQYASSDPAQGLSARLQTEMAKLKRFSVFSAHNRGGVMLFQSLADVGEAQLPEEVNMRDLDLVLTMNLMLTMEKHERYSDDLYVYRVDVDASCEDLHTHEVKFAEKASGEEERTRIISLTGRALGGYSPDEDSQAFQQAALKAIAKIAEKIAKMYPVGGKITGMLGERMTMDRGFEQGICANMPMVIYTVVGGINLPLAVAEASPNDYTANLVVKRWYNEDPYARRVIEQLNADLDWLQNHELYAANLGMPAPLFPDLEDLDRGL